MTVTAKASRKVISGSGWVNPLSHDIMIENASHIEVWADDAQLTLGVDYLVNNVLVEAGYTITIVNPMQWSPDVWVLDHRPPITQEADTSGGGQFGRAYEAAMDAIIRRLQSVDDRVSRALITDRSVPVGTQPPTLPLPENDTLIGWDEFGINLVNKPEASVSVNEALAAAAAALAAMPNAFPDTRTVLKGISTVFTRAAFLKEEGRRGQFVFVEGNFSSDVAADTVEAVFIAADDTPATLGAWVRADLTYLTPKMAGILHNATDEGAKFQALINVAARVGAYIWGTGEIRTSVGFTNHSGVPLLGFSKEVAKIRSLAGFTGEQIYYNDAPTAVIKGWGFYGNNDATAGNGLPGAIRFRQSSAATRDMLDVVVEDCHFENFAHTVWNRMVIEGGNFSIRNVTIKGNTYKSLLGNMRFPDNIGGHCSAWLIYGNIGSTVLPAPGVDPTGLITNVVIDDRWIDGEHLKCAYQIFGMVRDVSITTKRISGIGSTADPDKGSYAIMDYSARYFQVQPGTFATNGVNVVTALWETAHGLQLGDFIIPTITVNGLTAGVTYYIIPVDADRFRVCTTYENAIAGVFITMSGTAEVTYTKSVPGSRDARYRNKRMWVDKVGIYEPRDCGIYVANGEDPKITNCTFRGQITTDDSLLPKGAIAFNGPPGYSIAQGNTIVNCAFGVSVFQLPVGATARIKDNDITSTLADVCGVMLSGSNSGSGHRVYLENNFIELLNGNTRGVVMRALGAAAPFGTLKLRANDIRARGAAFYWPSGAFITELLFDGNAFTGGNAEAIVVCAPGAVPIRFAGLNVINMGVSTSHGISIPNCTNVRATGTIRFLGKPANAATFGWFAAGAQGTLDCGMEWTGFVNAERANFASTPLGTALPTWACGLGDIVRNINPVTAAGANVVAWRGTSVSGTWASESTTFS